MRKRLAGLLEDISSASVIVVGDIMLDEYIIGDSERISPVWSTTTRSSPPHRWARVRALARISEPLMFGVSSM